MAATIDSEAVFWLHEHIITLLFSLLRGFVFHLLQVNTANLTSWNTTEEAKCSMSTTITVSEKITSTTYFCHFPRPTEVRELREWAASGQAEGDARHSRVCAAPARGTREDSVGRITEGLPSAPSRRRMKTIKSYIQPCLHRKFSLHRC